MKNKWEYKITEIYADDQLTERSVKSSEEILNKLGSEGWEAVSAWGEEGWTSFVLLKREISK